MELQVSAKDAQIATKVINEELLCCQSIVAVCSTSPKQFRDINFSLLPLQ